jgi:hypothetical protein
MQSTYLKEWDTIEKQTTKSAETAGRKKIQGAFIFRR